MKKAYPKAVSHHEEPEARPAIFADICNRLNLNVTAVHDVVLTKPAQRKERVPGGHSTFAYPEKYAYNKHMPVPNMS
jgi:hypothetical protein